MKKIDNLFVDNLFVKVDSITRYAEERDLEANANRIGGAFQVTLNDSVTGAALWNLFIGELAGKENRRWAVIEKRGNKLRCIARKETLQDALSVVNEILKRYGIHAFSMEALARLS